MFERVFIFLVFVSVDVYTYPFEEESETSLNRIGRLGKLYLETSNVKRFESFSPVMECSQHNHAPFIKMSWANKPKTITTTSAELNKSSISSLLIIPSRDISIQDHWFGVTDPAELIQMGETLCDDEEYTAAFIFFDKAIRILPNEKSFAARSACYKRMAEILKSDLVYLEKKERITDYERKLLIEMYIDSKNWKGAANAMSPSLLSIPYFSKAVEIFDHPMSPSMCQARSKVLSRKLMIPRYVNFTLTLFRLQFLQRGRQLWVIKSCHPIGKETLKLTNSDEVMGFGYRFCYSEAYDEAQRCFDKIFNKEIHPPYYNLRARCYVRMGLVDEALYDFQTAVELDTDLDSDGKDGYERALVCLAFIEFEKFDEVEREITSLKSVQQTTLVLDELFAKEKFKEAIPCYSAAIEKFPQEAMYYKKRAKCYEKINEFENAIGDLQTAVGLNSLCWSCFRDLLEIFVKIKRYEDARNVLKNNATHFKDAPSDFQTWVGGLRQVIYTSIEKARQEKQASK